MDVAMTRGASIDRAVKLPFEALVAQHGSTVLRVVRAIVNPTDADDAWSDTFLSALKAYPELSNGADVEAWLVSMARRKAIDLIRSASRRPAPVAEPPHTETPEAADGCDLDLDAAVAALLPKQRHAVAYRYLEGLPYAEIATLLDSNVPAARRAAADGIANLRRSYPFTDAERPVRHI
jgi:RNA polymerase sigma factor (sigma-70 family)